MEARFNVNFKDGGKFNALFGEVQKVNTTNYEELNNKPQINGVTLIGNKTSQDIKVQDKMDVLTPQEIEKILYLN